MTAERIASISKYAWCIYSTNPKRVECADGDFDDFRSEMYLQGCLHEEDCAFLLKCVYYKKLKLKDSLQYNTSQMLNFSSLSGETEDIDYIEKIVGGKEDDYFLEENDSVIEELANLLYPGREEFQEGFICYMLGVPCWSSSRLRDCREKLFNWRFKILDFLYEKGKITERERDKFWKIAEELKEKQPVKKILSNNYEAVRQREVYHRNPEEARKKSKERTERYRAQKKKEHLEKEKQARQAESEQSKGDI